MSRRVLFGVALATFALAVIVVAVLWRDADSRRSCVATGSQQVTRDSHGGSTLAWRTPIEERCW